MERKVGGKFHLKLNIGSRPIANKYHEGKMKRTLKRELKVPEIAEREANGTSVLGEIGACFPHALFLALCVNVSSKLRKTPGTLVVHRWWPNVLG
jgi:hypothetical protein